MRAGPVWMPAEWLRRCDLIWRVNPQTALSCQYSALVWSAVHEPAAATGPLDLRGKDLVPTEMMTLAFEQTDSPLDTKQYANSRQELWRGWNEMEREWENEQGLTESRGLHDQKKTTSIDIGAEKLNQHKKAFQTLARNAQIIIPENRIFFEMQNTISIHISGLVTFHLDFSVNSRFFHRGGKPLKQTATV